MHLVDHLSGQIPQPNKMMGAPACPACPGEPWSEPWGLAFETWDPPSKGPLSSARNHSSTIRAKTNFVLLLLTILLSATMFAKAQSTPDPNKNPNGGEKPGPERAAREEMTFQPLCVSC
jgi:hypothetical protein